MTLICYLLPTLYPAGFSLLDWLMFCSLKKIENLNQLMIDLQK